MKIRIATIALKKVVADSIVTHLTAIELIPTSLTKWITSHAIIIRAGYVSWRLILPGPIIDGWWKACSLLQRASVGFVGFIVNYTLSGTGDWFFGVHHILLYRRTIAVRVPLVDAGGTCYVRLDGGSILLRSSARHPDTTANEFIRCC